MERGIVKWFDSVKGFGFIERKNKSDIFVHFQDIDMDGFKELNAGEEVEFNVEDGKKGQIAKNVRVIL